MREIDELINVGDPAWPLLLQELSDTDVPVEVLPVDAESGRACLRQLQVTARSNLGGIVLNCGGLLVDGGWLRIFGAPGDAGPEAPPALAEVNALPPAFDPQWRPEAGLVLAHDVLGGVFALNGSDARRAGRPGEPGEVVPPRPAGDQPPCGAHGGTPGPEPRLGPPARRHRSRIPRGRVNRAPGSVAVPAAHRYRRAMLQLIAPTTDLHSSWLEAHHEWGAGLHEDGFGLEPSDEVESPEGFAAWVALLAGASGAKAAGTDRGCLYRWIVEGDRVEGGIALRHGLSHHLTEFGHIGYGIRPSSRGRGLATWALGRMLDEARALGLDRVLLVCEVDNLASVGTIERNGGVLEGIRDTGHGPARRYWIEL
ncbi:GNAT family N-acetyltransferase [Streptomyces erythrochromogenes]|uniref:GNAT family N-acetyltransferase n=1 Tax=Streptomyces erythrochromogenes TaxID=285574 RepID=UPI0036C4C629